MQSKPTPLFLMELHEWEMAFKGLLKYSCLTKAIQHRQLWCNTRGQHSFDVIPLYSPKTYFLLRTWEYRTFTTFHLPASWIKASK
jgi:hypothetical protein